MERYVNFSLLAGLPGMVDTDSLGHIGNAMQHFDPSTHGSAALDNAKWFRDNSDGLRISGDVTDYLDNLGKNNPMQQFTNQVGEMSDKIGGSLLENVSPYHSGKRFGNMLEAENTNLMKYGFPDVTGGIKRGLNHIGNTVVATVAPKVVGAVGKKLSDAVSVPNIPKALQGGEALSIAQSNPIPQALQGVSGINVDIPAAPSLDSLRQVNPDLRVIASGTGVLGAGGLLASRFRNKTPVAIESATNAVMDMPATSSKINPYLMGGGILAGSAGLGAGGEVVANKLRQEN